MEPNSIRKADHAGSATEPEDFKTSSLESLRKLWVKKCANIALLNIRACFNSTLIKRRSFNPRLSTEALLAMVVIKTLSLVSDISALWEVITIFVKIANKGSSLYHILWSKLEILQKLRLKFSVNMKTKVISLPKLPPRYPSLWCNKSKKNKTSKFK